MSASELFEFLSVAATLKEELRDTLLKNGQREGVAGHCWMMSLMAINLAPHMQTPVDMATVLQMITLHDLPEAIAGDTPAHTTANETSKKLQHQKEQQAMQHLKKLAPMKNGQMLEDIWETYEKRQTPEARFVKAIDTLEVMFQSLQYPDIRYWANYGDSKIYYQIALDGRRRHLFEHEPLLLKFFDHIVGEIENRMRSAGLNPDEYRCANS